MSHSALSVYHSGVTVMLVFVPFIIICSKWLKKNYFFAFFVNLFFQNMVINVYNCHLSAVLSLKKILSRLGIA